MTIADIPYAHHTHIHPGTRHLTLTPDPDTINHIGTLHAGALFTLAETATGFYLASLFPESSEEMLPLLRSSSVKYKRPATTTIHAIATVEDDALEAFTQLLEKRGRATVSVDIELLDEEDHLCMQGTFGWYVQKKV
jgi:acyl-coenzyme A thioesterase PaaI-like protein